MESQNEFNANPYMEKALYIMIEIKAGQRIFFLK